MSDNVIDGSESKDLIEVFRESYDLDLPAEQTLVGIEGWIKDVSSQIGVAQAALAIELDYIDREALYAQAGYATMTEYSRDAPDRLNMPKQTLSNYLAMGRALRVYRKKLTGIKYDPRTGIHKLRFVDDALEIHKEPEVWRNFTKMSLREFAEYARPKAIESTATFDDDDINIVPQPDGLWYAGRNMVPIKDLRKILQSGDTPYLVGVYDDGEKRVIQAALKAHRAKK